MSQSTINQMTQGLISPASNERLNCMTCNLSVGLRLDDLNNKTTLG